MLTEHSLQALQRYHRLGKLAYRYEEGSGLRIEFGVTGLRYNIEFGFSPAGSTGPHCVTPKENPGHGGFSDVNIALSLPREDLPLLLASREVEILPGVTVSYQDRPGVYYAGGSRCTVWHDYVGPLVKLRLELGDADGI